MREMGVTFDIGRDRPWGRRPWYCDLMPHIVTESEWKPLVAGMTQRLHAYECFLRDVYGERRILRQSLVPLHPVLGSPYYQHAASGLRPPDGAFLHLSGMAVSRRPSGEFVVKHQYFSHASGISYMIQNRRAMARVMPQAFADYMIHSIADVPTDILEVLRGFSQDEDPTVVLLSSGQGSAVYSEHSFLARRMGIPLVEGGDLLVLNSCVYLKTVSGLERVEVIYSRLSDNYLDPLVFRRDSLLGVPGLVQCIRMGTVAVINAVGSQLADDRALLAIAPAIIRYYLGEVPILDGLETYWLGDLDQRELVLEDLDQYTVRPLYGERILTPPNGHGLDDRRRAAVIREILENPALFVAQPRDCDALTVSYDGGRPEMRTQDHILFSLRTNGGDFTVFPGALTRVSTDESPFTASELGGGSKDTWVASGAEETVKSSPRLIHETRLPSQHVTSRVAEAFYWTGRYLERARNLAGMIAVIEALEAEELNPTERMLYRPVWNRILPLLDGGGGSRRTISNPQGRYRLTLDLTESGSVVNAVQRATWNGESILECLSLEAWAVLSQLQSRFQRTRLRRTASDAECSVATRKMCDHTTALVAQFFGAAQTTMIADGGWRFCLIGQMVERASTTGNALGSMMRSLLRASGPAHEHAREIQLSAFLRLLGSRDVYRRVYQMRIEPGAVLQMLWLNPVVPRSVSRCLAQCASLLAESQADGSPAMGRTVAGIEALHAEIAQTDWDLLAEAEIVEPRLKGPEAVAESVLLHRIEALLDRTLGIHHLISDGFLNHQIHMRGAGQPLLKGFSDAV